MFNRPVPISRAPKVGECLLFKVYGKCPRFYRVRVLEVFPAVCKVESVDDGSQFCAHVGLLFNANPLSSPARAPTIGAPSLEESARVH